MLESFSDNVSESTQNLQRVSREFKNDTVITESAVPQTNIKNITTKVEIKTLTSILYDNKTWVKPKLSSSYYYSRGSTFKIRQTGNDFVFELK